MLLVISTIDHDKLDEFSQGPTKDLNASGVTGTARVQLNGSDCFLQSHLLDWDRRTVGTCKHQEFLQALSILATSNKHQVV